MPTYHFECRECGHDFEIMRSIKDDLLKQCPACKQETLRSVLYAPTVFNHSDPKTIGALADRNRSQLGHYEREAKDHANAQNKVKAKRKAMKNLPSGMKSMRSNKPTPPAWWRPGKAKPDLKLAKKSTDKWKKYIAEGKD